MPKIDLASAPTVRGTRYPAPFDEPCRTRENKQLGVAAGLSQFGVNLTRLPPGAWSSQRHWHTREDELIYVIEGEVWLVEDDSEICLFAGDAAGFRGGVKNGHHLQNRSQRDAVVLTIGARDHEDAGEYPDIDMIFRGDRYSGKGGFAHKDGTPY